MQNNEITADLMFFLAISQLLSAMIPGISFLFVTKNAVKRLSNGMKASIGMALGAFAWSILSLFFKKYIFGFDNRVNMITQVMLAIYLLYLGLKCNQIFFMDKTKNKKYNLNDSRIFLDSFFITISNPKVGLFYLSVFSSLIPGQISISNALLVATQVFNVELLWFCFVSFVVWRGFLYFDRFRNKIEFYSERTIGVLFIFFSFNLFGELLK